MRPVGAQGRNSFIGRDAELKRILRAVMEDHSHVILYGERGYGKTSLANLAMGAIRKAGLPVSRHVCSVGSDFDTIMRGLFRGMPLRSLDLALPGTADGVQNGEALLPPRPVRPADVVAVATRFGGVRPVLVIDEFDRIADDATRVSLADTIKQLSDESVGPFS
ncbi:ATP-binding protein [Dankookia sp. P2]|uniref:ATP-binding protein n=1 Tax=Dankookia sp. P2 TaxID=3423955 RepID=UPI003D6657CA